MTTGSSGVTDQVPWQTILDQATGPIVVLDLHARVIYINPALSRLLGYDPDYLLGQEHPSRQVTHPDELVLDRDAIDAMIAGTVDNFEAERRLLRSDGSVVWTLISSAIIRDSGGAPVFFLSQIQDISVLRKKELLWQQTLTSAPVGMALIDLNGYWTEVNDKLCDLVGYRREELLTMHFTDLTYADESTRDLDLLADLKDGRQDTVNIEKRYRHKDGHPIWMLIRASVVPGADDEPEYVVSQYETIGDGRMRDSHLAHMALHDALTGLANRALLIDRLDQGRTELSQHGGVLTVLLADLDELKPVNDHYGHAVGDQLLITAANELLNAVHPGDTVARLGGDEFVVVTRVPDHAAAEALRERVANRLHTDILVAGHHLSMGASVGLATTHNPATPADALLHSADRDMYRYKTRAR